MNLSMTGGLADAYRSGAQRTRVVTEAWGESNLYCPNCSSPRLDRLKHNTKASDFSCPKCGFWYQLKGQKTAIRSTVTDGAYESMMDAIRSDRAPNYYFLHYDLPTWTIKNLLLIPKFAFPASAIIKRPALKATARRAGWVGCNFALDRIPVDARIDIVRDPPSQMSSYGGLGQVVSSPALVREQFKKIKSAFAELSTRERGWTLDVLNMVRRIEDEGRGRGRLEFSNEDVYAYERELEALHPDNRHIRDKIRQQLQVLRDRGFLVHLGRNRWRTA
jgi:type II restriction enzyme